MEVFDYLTRAEWGARPPRSVRTVLPHQFTAVEIHHSATGVLPAAKAAQSFQASHMDRNGWLDLFYNWLIHPDGTIVEGRGWGTSPRPENFMTVCFIGDYTQDQLTDAARASAGVLVRECWRRMPQLKDQDVRWHNQRASTACPGGNLVQFVKEQNVLNGWGATTSVVPVENEVVVSGPSDDELNQLAAAAFALDYRAQRRASSARALSVALADLRDELAELAVLTEDNLNAVRRLRKEYGNG